MPKPDYNIELSIGFSDRATQLLAMSSANAMDLFPNQAAAIQRLADIAHRKWIKFASGEPMPNGKTINRWTGDYASSIKISVDGKLNYTIYSDSPLAEVIEYGSDAWDMKIVLQTSHKARLSEKGKKYLIIPFRHGTPNTIVLTQYVGNEIPVPVHSWFLQRDHSSIVGQRTEKSIQDGFTDVKRNVYQWGDRLTQGDLEDMGINPHAEGKNLVGMVRMKTDSGSQYMTFRVMSEDSPADSWQQQAREGKYPAQQTYEFIMQHYEKVMQTALELDIQALKDAT